MSTTVDDLIALKDSAVSLAYALANVSAAGGDDWATVETLISQARGIVQLAEEYDEADADERAASVEHWNELQRAHGSTYVEPELEWDEDRAEEGYDCPRCDAWIPAHRQHCADCGLDTATLRSEA